MKDWTIRLRHLEDAHRHQHKIVEALEAEKAPGNVVYDAKKKKLELKDQIEQIKRQNPNVD